MKNIALLFCLFMTSLQFAQETKISRIEKSINQKLDQLWKESKAPGLSMTVVLPEGEALTFTRGFADVEKQQEMTASTKMLGGSTGKVFYSVVALQIIEEGKLQLDTPIFDTMSDYKWFERIPNAKQLTVRSLMRHETGIPRYVFKDSFQKDVLKDVNKIWKPEELLAYVIDEKPLFEVGTGFAYSDTNYIILGMLIEKVTGNDLYDEVQKRVSDRAGLQNVVPQNKRSYKNIAQGYNDENDSFFPGLQFNKKGKSNYNLQFEWAGGGLVFTSHDLAVLGKKIYEGKMFSPKLLDEYFKGIDAGKLRGQWGLGVHIMETPNGTVYGHSGFMPGYITNVLYFADDQFSICFQVNTSQKERTTITRYLPGLSKTIADILKE